jgi:WD40 repeat protein
MQERYSKLDKSTNALNTSSNSGVSGGGSSSIAVMSKKSHALRRVLFQSKCTLKSHLDSVRGLHFGPQALASAAEDCTVRLWDVNKFSNIKDAEGVLNFEPYVTLRGHLSPIMSMSGPEGGSSNLQDENVLITGSKNGVLKIWAVPSTDQVNFFGPGQDKNYCIQSWEGAHDTEAIWDIRLHQRESIFLSSGSDSTVALWSLPST